jgi:hypothetical protein
MIDSGFDLLTEQGNDFRGGLHGPNILSVCGNSRKTLLARIPL